MTKSVDQILLAVQEPHSRVLKRLHVPFDHVDQAKREIFIINTKCGEFSSDLASLNLRIEENEAQIKTSNEEILSVASNLSQIAKQENERYSYLMKQDMGLRIDVLCLEKKASLLKEACSELEQAQGSLKRCIYYLEDIIETVERKTTMRMRQHDEESHIKWAKEEVERFEKYSLWHVREFHRLVEEENECVKIAHGFRIELEAI